MKSINKSSRILGVAFLFQFVTSFFSMTIILPQTSGISTMSPPENTVESQIRIANHPGLMMVDILS